MNGTETNGPYVENKDLFYVGCAFASLFLIPNLVVVIMVCLLKKLNKSPHVFFVLSLSVSDSMVCVSSITFLATATLNIKVTVWFCTMQYIILYTSLLASCGQVLLICIERFIVTTYQPIGTYKTFSKKKKKMYVLLNWFVSCFVMVSLIVHIPKDTEFQNCLYVEIFHQNFKTFSLTVGIIFTIVVLINMSFHVATAYRISKSIPKSRFIRKRRISPDQESVQENNHVELKVTFLLNQSSGKNDKQEKTNKISHSFTDNESQGKILNHVNMTRKNAERQREIEFQSLSGTPKASNSRTKHTQKCSLVNCTSVDSTDNQILAINPRSNPANLITDNIENKRKVKHLAQKQRAFTTVTIILITFTVCFVPSTILYFVRPYHDIPKSIDSFTYVLLQLHCLTNPLLYAWRLPIFRNYFLRQK